MSRKKLLVVVFLLVSFGMAFAFQFSPLEQEFEPTGANSQKTYTVVNDSEDQIAIEFSVLQRNQDASGEEVRSASSAEFVISPAKVIVAPSSTYVVRVKYINALFDSCLEPSIVPSIQNGSSLYIWQTKALSIFPSLSKICPKNEFFPDSSTTSL